MEARVKTIRFGIMLFPYDRYHSVQEMLDVTGRADELGYYAVELAEHLLPPKAAEEQFQNRTWYDNFVLAACIAGATKRVRPLLHVVFPYHNPFALAKSLATLDVMSGGRVLCNVATGWMKEEFEQLGVPFEERGAITDEYIRVLRKLWKDDAPSFSGTYATFSNVSFYPKPVQTPHIPLLIGGTGPRPCRRAAELGDGWHPMRGSLAELRQGIEWIRTQVAASGRDPDLLHFGFNALAVDMDDAIQTAREHAGDKKGSSGRRTPDELVAQVRRFQEIGVNYLTISFAWQTPSDLVRELNRFALEVMPVFVVHDAGPQQ